MTDNRVVCVWSVVSHTRWQLIQQGLTDIGLPCPVGKKVIYQRWL